MALINGTDRAECHKNSHQGRNRDTHVSTQTYFSNDLELAHAPQADQDCGKEAYEKT
jgi:hypothetical protein